MAKDRAPTTGSLPKCAQKLQQGYGVQNLTCLATDADS